MKRCLSFLFILLAVIVVGACKPTSATSPQATLPPLPQASTTPYLITVIPTPSAPDKCTITGVLLVRPGPQPVKRALLALADVIETNGTPIVASMDSRNAPRTLTDDNGRFVFVDVPADTYTLILDKITESFLLSHPTSGKDMLITCEAGQVIDLGELTYSELPLPTPVK